MNGIIIAWIFGFWKHPVGYKKTGRIHGKHLIFMGLDLPWSTHWSCCWFIMKPLETRNGTSNMAMSWGVIPDLAAKPCQSLFGWWFKTGLLGILSKTLLGIRYGIIHKNPILISKSLSCWWWWWWWWWWRFNVKSIPKILGILKKNHDLGIPIFTSGSFRIFF